jgi:hypothetical protein
VEGPFECGKEPLGSIKRREFLNYGSCQTINLSRKILLHGAPEDGSSMLLRNFGIYLQVHTALLPRRPVETSSPPEREPEIS